MATTTDEKVQKFFDIVQKKKLELEKITKAENRKWITNCSFAWDENNLSTRINLQTISDPRVIVKALAKLEQQAKHEAEAAEKLGVDEYKFEWLNYSLEDWTQDFQTRLAKIQSTKKKKELAELETRLNALISPELKAEMELDAISKMLED